MKTAYVFPGQASQHVGMGKEMYDSSEEARILFDRANDLLGFDITDVMFNGTEEDLKRTDVAQPAVFLNSVIKWLITEDINDIFCVGGHSLGEYSALVACHAISFTDALHLVKLRADEMQKACDLHPGTMAAVLGLDNEVVEKITSEIDEIVVPANYNCPGQLVISGTDKGIELACAKLTEAGAKRCLPLKVGGAFHSPLMEPAKEALEREIMTLEFQDAMFPIYQNVSGKAVRNKDEIKQNLISQLSQPVRWTQTMHNMIDDGVERFVEVGGRVIQGFVKRIDRRFPTATL